MALQTSVEHISLLWGREFSSSQSPASIKGWPACTNTVLILQLWTNKDLHLLHFGHTWKKWHRLNHREKITRGKVIETEVCSASRQMWHKFLGRRAMGLCFLAETQDLGHFQKCRKPASMKISFSSQFMRWSHNFYVHNLYWLLCCWRKALSAHCISSRWWKTQLFLDFFTSSHTFGIYKWDWLA